jgi:hypothetical protein
MNLPPREPIDASEKSPRRKKVGRCPGEALVLIWQNGCKLDQDPQAAGSFRPSQARRIGIPTPDDRRHTPTSGEQSP